MISIVKRRAPEGAIHRVLERLHEGLIEPERIVNDDMQTYSRISISSIRVSDFFGRRTIFV